jgi:hypothetical protein
VRRHLYKSELGNQVIFEEVHQGLGLVFRARWQTSEAFGFVRTVTLENQTSAPVLVRVLDGLTDLMPAGVAAGLQQGSSCLVNAYTRADVDPETRLGLICLQALIVDQPVPAESLRATTVFCAGLDEGQVVLSTDQAASVRRGLPVHAEPSLTGRRAGWLVSASFTLEAQQTRRWSLVADVERDHVQVEALRARLLEPASLGAAIAADVALGTAALLQNVGSADGLQQTADRRVTVHHFANVLFNNMRGGVFADGHQVSWADFAAFLALRNRPLAERLRPGLSTRAGQTTVRALLEWAQQAGEPDLLRLAHEYLPLFFSRRHGDPSRPWNAFAIRLRTRDGSRALDYQGNWRDIFQNWEALCTSHPCFLESVIATFVDASTADGFNPYRLSRAGIDWEVPEEDNPWATIGYWGDHQIVYLGRLLEALERTRPGRLEALLAQRWFSHADVPYRLSSARQIAANPRATLRFDHEAAARAAARVERLGGDGKLLHGADGELVRASFFEKLLLPVLAKLANLVLDGGIWMNTQRPEWNDANNALVGDGLSVVTLCQLRRHLAFLQALFSRAAGQEAELSGSASSWLARTCELLEASTAVLEPASASDAGRRALLDELQLAFEHYREARFGPGFDSPVPVPVGAGVRLCALALRYVDHSIRANRRADQLYHSYNLLALHEGEATAQVAPLYEMLEGQVAVLSAGLLSPEEALGLLDALFASRLFRADQQSFLLYPDRALPGFLQKNHVPEASVTDNPLLQAMLAQGEARLVSRDVRGGARFAGHLQTLADVRATLAEVALDPRFTALVQAHGEAVARSFEAVFGLKGFTGRSGTMYGYEGLGCIYWHMVSKLLLAVQEVHAAAQRAGAPQAQLLALARAYYRVRQGLGFNKSAQVWGAFPTDPYSHSPKHAGAQQPGMTGSVKEEILTRLGELGVEVREGRVRFAPGLLSARELLRERTAWKWVDATGAARELSLGAGELGFTLCQVPVLYRLAERRTIEVHWADGLIQSAPDGALDALASRAILERTGEVLQVEVALLRDDLLDDAVTGAS